MEDTLIIPGSFAYHLRIDVLDASNNRVEEVKQSTYNIYKWKVENFLKENFTNYYVFLEHGAKTNKLHFQGILWSQYQYTNKFINKLKAKYFLWHRQRKNSLALTSAKKISSLASYVQKDKNIQFNHLTDSQREKIPTWQKQDMSYTVFRKKLYSQIKKWKGETIGDPPHHKKREIAIKIIKYYWDDKRRQPSRMDLIKILGHHGLYSATEVLNNYKLWE